MRSIGAAHVVLLACIVYIVVLFICGSLPAYAEDGAGPVLIPSFGRFGPLETNVIWQMPDGPVKKIFLLLAPIEVPLTDFWDHSPSCTVCRGLPEKRKLVIDALARNWAVVIPDSLVPNNDWMKWPIDNPDAVNVVTILSEWKTLHKLEDVPMVALASSAGSFMLGTLGLYPGLLESVAFIVGSSIVEVWDAATEQYPPTLFVHMPKDVSLSRKIQYARSQLTKKGVPCQELRWYEHPVTPEWFSELIPQINETLSFTIQQKLMEEGWIDHKTKLFLTDEFRDKWTDNVLRRWNIVPRNFMEESLLVSLLEEANVAFAQHQTVARNDVITFDWLDGSYNSLGVATY